MLFILSSDATTPFGSFDTVAMLGFGLCILIEILSDIQSLAFKKKDVDSTKESALGEARPARLLLPARPVGLFTAPGTSDKWWKVDVLGTPTTSERSSSGGLPGHWHTTAQKPPQALLRHRA